MAMAATTATAGGGLTTQTECLLLMEIKEAIKNLKQQKKVNQLTDHQFLFLLELRGQLLYVKISSAAVGLGPRPRA